MNTILVNWRKQINTLDGKLIDILAKRIHVVNEIGKHKKVHGLPPLDEKRWQEVQRSACIKARSAQISEQFIKKLYSLIHEYSLEIEKRSTEL